MTPADPAGAQPVDRHDVAEAFRAIAELLEALGENPFKSRAYVNGAKALEAMEGELGELIASGELARTRGFGQALVEKATTLWTTGRLPYLEELRSRFPPALLELGSVPGLGPRKALALHAALGVDGLDALETACRDGRVATVPGFGARTESRILEGVAFARRSQQRRLRSSVEPAAARLLAELQAVHGVERAAIAGSLRRCRETIGQILVVVAADDAGAILDACPRLPSVPVVVERDAWRATMRLGSRLLANVVVVPPDRFGSALLVGTGSAAFLDGLRARAAARGLAAPWAAGGEPAPRSDQDPGADAGAVLENDRDESDRDEDAILAPRLDPALLAPVPDERSLFSALGLPELPPEVRETFGDAEPAAGDAWPSAGEPLRLVESSDLKGILHVHSTWSDGRESLEDMVLAAQARGWSYVGISDHSQSAVYANGMSAERVLQQREDLQRLQERVRIRILKGVESDIRADGSLDYPDEILEGFDFVIASVHSQFRMGPEEMTRRLVRAASQPKTRVLGHPTGRLLLKRQGYAFDVDAVLAACRAHDVAVEINAWPNRLDLDWREARKLPAAGVLACINPDAHRSSELDFVRYGVEIARKARLGPENVLNTRSADALLARRPA